jgi:hypothetical protein
MDELTEFLERHMPRLQQYIDGLAPKYRVPKRFLSYVEEVLDEWATVGLEARRRDYQPGERVFWYTLYLMEELAELPRSADRDPYVAMMRDTLQEMRRHLARRADLPPRYDVCRPGMLELFADDDLEFIGEAWDDGLGDELDDGLDAAEHIAPPPIRH